MENPKMEKPKMKKRTAHLLTCNIDSERTQFAKSVLERVGFDVQPFVAIPHEVPVLSHRQSVVRIIENFIQEKGSSSSSSGDDKNDNSDNGSSNIGQDWLYIYSRMTSICWKILR